MAKLLAVYNQKDLNLLGSRTNQFPPFEVSGADLIYSSASDSKTVYAFTNTGSSALIVSGGPGSYSVDYFIVAGGGSGGSPEGGCGGGGAGGFRTGTIPASGPIVVTVGAGGVLSDLKGGDSSLSGSVLSDIIATGGGRGGLSNTSTGGQPGGSGGGAASVGNNSNGTGTTVASPDGISPTVQGYPGGTGTSDSNSYREGGGGGGGNQAGGNAPNQAGGKGGDGVRAPSIFLSDLVSLGAPGPAGSFYFAGGGAGGSYRGSGVNNPASGGGGIGGGGSPNPNQGHGSSTGLANSGGGGGGNDQNGGYGTGGSGIVLLRVSEV